MPKEYRPLNEPEELLGECPECGQPTDGGMCGKRYCEEAAML